MKIKDANTAKGAIFIAAFTIVTVFFNCYSQGIDDFNAAVRALISKGTIDRRSFDVNGFPIYTSPRIGTYTSPFYVVHYGLQYSEACRKNVSASGEYHWLKDETLTFWHSSPLEPSLDLFRKSVDWVLENTALDRHGNAHLYYQFDWPYKNHPGGILRAPWWSGLTEGHAITLLMRAADCFGDKKYLSAAESFYHSILTPVEYGGSLLELNGLPWIEEYVDSRAPIDGLSRVFNGMVYAYFGIEAFERRHSKLNMSPILRESIIKNAEIFDLNYWSYYDAIGGAANIKYHRINLALIMDHRLRDDRFNNLAGRWSLGSSFAVPFYLIHGPYGYAKAHFFITYILLIFVIYIAAISIFKRINMVKKN